MPKFQLLPAKQYVADLTRAVANARKEIYLMAIVITDDSSTHELIKAVLAAAKRGVKVYVAADAYTFGALGGYYSPLKKFHSDSRQARRMAHAFKAAGSQFVWLGDRRKLNFFGGNTHIKWSVVDDTVYSFGGVNLYRTSTACADYMLKVISKPLSLQLISQHQQIVACDAARRDYGGLVSASDFGTLYIDSGQRGDSPIYNRVCELAGLARKVIYVSQYCPTGSLALLLKKTNTQFYFNQPAGKPLTTKVLLHSAMLRSKLRSRYQRADYLHAKLMLFEMKDGQKIAMTGSHNFNYAGVRFGTREVALETSDLNVYSQLKNFFDKNIA